MDILPLHYLDEIVETASKAVEQAAKLNKREVKAYEKELREHLMKEFTVREVFEELKPEQYAEVNKKALDLLKKEGDSGLAEEALTEDSKKHYQNNMTCLICQNIAIQEEPVTCKNCKRYFCTPCLDKWSEENSNCPSCRGEFDSDNQQTHELKKTGMEKLNFKCPDCDFKGNWKVMRTHFAGECKKRDYHCPFGCAFSDKQDKLKEHFLECPNVEIGCNRCDLTNIKRKDKQEHDCLEALKETLSKKQDDIANLRHVETTIKEGSEWEASQQRGYIAQQIKKFGDILKKGSWNFRSNQTYGKMQKAFNDATKRKNVLNFVIRPCISIPDPTLDKFVQFQSGECIVEIML